MPARSQMPANSSCQRASSSDEAAAQLGQALADEGLGRVDELDGRLGAALFAHQPLLLPGVLQVVAGKRFVREQTDQSGRTHGQVGVDLDA